MCVYGPGSAGSWLSGDRTHALAARPGQHRADRRTANERKTGIAACLLGGSWDCVVGIPSLWPAPNTQIFAWRCRYDKVSVSILGSCFLAFCGHPSTVALRNHGAPSWPLLQVDEEEGPEGRAGRFGDVDWREHSLGSSLLFHSSRQCVEPSRSHPKRPDFRLGPPLGVREGRGWLDGAKPSQSSQPTRSPNQETIGRQEPPPPAAPQISGARQVPTRI